MLDCQIDRMSGFIRLDAFNDPSIINKDTMSLARQVILLKTMIKILKSE